MDRRQVLTVFGAAAAGLTAGALPSEVQADEHKFTAPLDNLHAYLCAFHLAKKDPRIVIEAHHYCAPVNDSLHQCIIFDHNTKNARILGVEYIITDKVYRSLPDEEKKYYHPHTYEVTSGLLIAPGMEPKMEKEFMAFLLTTWGKCWHTWPNPKDPLPMGEPLLMWSAMKDGMVSKEALAARDKEFKVDTAEIRKERAVLGPVPQVEHPRNLEALGRQWTNDGPDVPPKK
jgi:hypothetical protein